MNTGKKRIPGPSSVAEASRHLWLALRGSTAEDSVTTFGRFFDRHGDIVRLNLFGLQALLLRDPEMIAQPLVNNAKNYRKGPGIEGLRLVLGQGLITSEGDLWHRQRKLIQPLFHSQALSRDVRIVDRLARAWVDRTLRAPPESRVEDLSRSMAALSLESLCRTLIGAMSPERMDQVYLLIEKALSAADDETTGLLRLFSGFRPLSWLKDLPTASRRHLAKTVRELDALVEAEIAARPQALPGQGDTLLALLSRQSMEPGQLRDELLTLFVAGHETTASALTWCLYLLSKNPRAEARVLEEIRGLPDREPTGDVRAILKEAPYLSGVVLEAMRLYPPVWRFPRAALQDDEIGGYPVKAGTSVITVSFYAHRHPDYWKDPELFSPERFMEGAAEKQHRCAYIPFGAGPRACIGSSFALLETQLFLRRILSAFRLEWPPGILEAPLRFHSRISLFPAGGLKARWVPRAR